MAVAASADAPNSPLAPVKDAATPERRIVRTVKEAEAMLRRLGQAADLPASGDPQDRTHVEEVIRRIDGAIGCKTEYVANALLSQILLVEHPDHDNLTSEQLSEASQRATAELAELSPTDAAQGFLGAQMLGTHRLAMSFMSRAAHPYDRRNMIDRLIQRSTRLMRLYIDQVQTLAKLKGKGGQQRVVVEHVNVAAGGQAIVGAVATGGEEGV